MSPRWLAGLVREWLRERRDERLRAPLLRRWEALARLPAEELGREVVARLRAILQHADATVPFWRERLRAAGIRPERVDSLSVLHDLEPIERDVVMERRDELLSSAVPPRDRLPARTGGSSVRPLSFFRDPACVRERRALQDLFFAWAGRGPRERWAIVWGASFDLDPSASRLATFRELVVHRRISLSGARLDPADMELFLRRCERVGVRLIHGYTVALCELARHVTGGGHRPSGLRGITTTAEPLAEEQRRTIQDAFGVPVFNQYGSREMGMAAAECHRHAGLHLATPSVVIEALRPDGTPADPGERGDLVITDLLNRAMPFLRYRVGDMGSFAGTAPTCGLGFPLLEIDAGKVLHYVSLPDGRMVPGAPLVVSLDTTGLRGLYLEQHIEGEVTVLFIPGEGFTPAVLERVEKGLLRLLGVDIPVRFRQVSSPPVAPSGKVLLCHSTVSERRLRRRPAPP